MVQTLTFYPEAQILVRFALQLTILRYMVFENRKCIEWPQTDLDHLPLKVSCAHYKYLRTRSHILVRFALQPAFFKNNVIENQKYTDDDDDDDDDEEEEEEEEDIKV